MIIWLFAVGVLAGIISGMGIGGGTILIPALVLLFEIPQKSAQSINLIYFIPTAVVALITHIKNKQTDKAVIKPLIPSGILGAVIGAFIALNTDNTILRIMFGCFMAVIGIRELWIGFKQG
jgi:hypothetical protein